MGMRWKRFSKQMMARYTSNILSGEGDMFSGQRELVL